jgi:hypothetical protein
MRFRDLIEGLPGVAATWPIVAPGTNSHPAFRPVPKIGIINANSGKLRGSNS